MEQEQLKVIFQLQAYIWAIIKPFRQIHLQVLIILAIELAKINDLDIKYYNFISNQ